MSLVLVSAGCKDDPIAAVQPDPHTTFWRLAFNYRAIVLSTEAPHNTVQLVATPLNIFGDTLASPASVTYRLLEVSDTALTVGTDGAVMAVSETPRTAVIARLTIDGVTLADTAYVMVRTGPVVPLQSFSLRPEPPDSNWMWSMNVLSAPRVFPGAKSVKATAIDQNGQVVPEEEILVATWPERTEVVRRQEIYQNVILASVAGDTGSAVINAEVLYYGTLWTDTLRLHVIPMPYRIARISTIQPFSGPVRRELQPTTMTIYAGTTIQWDIDSPVMYTHKLTDLSFLQDDPDWSFLKDQVGSSATITSGDSVDLIFDHPELIEAGAPAFIGAEERMPQGGNVGAWSWVRCMFATGNPCSSYFSSSVYSRLQADGISRTRSFPVPGTYHYHSVRYPAVQGTIIVLDSMKVPPPPMGQRNGRAHAPR